MQPNGVDLWYFKLRSNRIHNLKYLRFTTLGCEDIVIRKSEFVAMWLNSFSLTHNYFQLTNISILISLQPRVCGESVSYNPLGASNSKYFWISAMGLKIKVIMKKICFDNLMISEKMQIFINLKITKLILWKICSHIWVFFILFVNVPKTFPRIQ